ncbi:hypothetical protein CBS101457_006516 [Exobasidium rhododendri]|nr:hypothetical protein CBS101457_006516 [Exobasidium rhododendri]
MPCATVVGAGPVGCLVAVGLHQRGYDVTIYEIRPEAAFQNVHSNSRSINLAISTRGLTALSAVDSNLSRIVLENAVPMKGRMIHSNSTRPGDARKDGAASERRENISAEGVLLDSQSYSSKGQCINSVSRNLLNRLLLDQVIECGIKICWSHKLLQANMEGKSRRQQPPKVTSGSAGSSSLSPPADADTVEDGQVELIFDSQEEKGFHRWTDLIVGCDGHHSKVRAELGRTIELDYNQHYIDNYYSELHIPINKETEDFALDPHHLHIWPRHDFMLIALPNQDKTFTSTLFAPKRIFTDHLNDEHRLVDFFRAEFPDALKVIGEARLVKDLLGVRPSSLGTIECKPYHFRDRLIILGDASHAMVPFYGQGLNCGLEDVRIMLELLDKHLQKGTDAHQGIGSSTEGVATTLTASNASARTKRNEEEQNLALVRERAFDEYSSSRHADLIAISQLAMDNFHEMSSKVVSRTFRIRKQIDSLLVTYLPDQWWDSLYTLVTFSNIGYHKAQQREAKQVRILNAVGLTSLASLSITGVFCAFRFTRGAM